MKKVLILGASGRTGRHISKYLENYSPKDFKGDAMDLKTVEKQVKGCDAVISVIGHVKGSYSRVQTKSINNVIAAMKAHQIKRVISLTGTGVRVPGDQPSLIDKLMNTAVTIIDRQRVEDGIAHFEVLKNSNLDWTVVRVLKLTNSTKSQTWRFSATGPAKTFIARREVAKAIAQILEDDSFVKEAPIISR